ncbi:hypothetical protein HP475_13575 [Serratia marcescens]|uniref:hypothetical protein n=1 Tax=Serratia marcescens TaxID=615 RepID=UPI0015D765BB|nr:hypothetical protein [Serratia marcescens]QLJ60885.1 hypothetical protein HP475_13575 [Serratia marcescens]
MKKLILVALAGLYLSGCAEMNAKQEAEAQKSYADMSQCDTPKFNKNSVRSKGDFVKELNSQALSASADDFVSQQKLDRLQLVGWNDSVSSAIISCNVNTKKQRVSIMNAAFEEIKAKTKDKDEKKALISAYSSWETYVKTPSRETKSKFDNELSYYKNM